MKEKQNLNRTDPAMPVESAPLVSNESPDRDSHRASDQRCHNAALSAPCGLEVARTQLANRAKDGGKVSEPITSYYDNADGVAQASRATPEAVVRNWDQGHRFLYKEYSCLLWLEAKVRAC